MRILENYVNIGMQFLLSLVTLELIFGIAGEVKLFHNSVIKKLAINTDILKKINSAIEG